MSFYKGTFMVATSVATAAAVMIMRPWAFYVAAGLGTIVSNPEGMDESALNWKSGDLDALDKQLDDLKTQLKEQGTWEGQAFQNFEQVHKSFKESLGTLKEMREGTSEAVSSTSGFYKVLAYFCSAVALGMMAYAIWKMVARSNPATAAVAETTDAAVGATTTKVMKGALLKHAVAVGILASLLLVVKGQTQAAGKLFPNLKAIPTEMNAMQNGNFRLKPFTNDGLVYDPNTGALLPKSTETLEM